MIAWGDTALKGEKKRDARIHVGRCHDAGGEDGEDGAGGELHFDVGSFGVSGGV